MVVPCWRTIVGERLLGDDAGTGRDLLDAVPRQRRSGKDAARQRDAGERDAQVVGHRQVVGLQRRALERIGRLGHDRAAALGPRDADRDGHAGLALQLAELVLVVARRREQQLDVGARQPLAAAANACALDTPKVSAPRPVVSQRAISRAKPQPARQLVDRHRVLDAMRDAHGVVVGQVGADAGQVVDDIDADRLQVRAPGRCPRPAADAAS